MIFQNRHLHIETTKIQEGHRIMESLRCILLILKQQRFRRASWAAVKDLQERILEQQRSRRAPGVLIRISMNF